MVAWKSLLRPHGHDLTVSSLRGQPPLSAAVGESLPAHRAWKLRRLYRLTYTTGYFSCPGTGIPSTQCFR
ncbi:MAG: hypothetical protein MZV63_04125 [Marinilabiliales bacterium]|nr:hypothetical protein [Marinilabiliales bacterium]